MKKLTKDRPITYEKYLLPERAYEEYKEIFIKEFGYKPNKEEIIRGANDLINLFKAFSEPKVRTKSGQSY